MHEIPFDIVGFDLDGTLVDTHRDLGEAVNHALGLAHRPAVPIAQVRSLVGGGSRLMLLRALEATGGPLPDEEVAELHRHLLDHYEANIAVHSRLFPGGDAMLAGLTERGIKLAVVTNKLERYTRLLLDALDLTRNFACILGGDSLGPGRGKPEPDLLVEMIVRCGGGSGAYVGDTTFDTRAAIAAGIPCVAVSFGFNDLPPQDLGAAAVIGHFDRLIPVLEGLGVTQP